MIIKANTTSQANTNSCNFDEFRIDGSSKSTADQVIDFVTGQVSTYLLTWYSRRLLTGEEARDAFHCQTYASHMPQF